MMALLVFDAAACSDDDETVSLGDSATSSTADGSSASPLDASPPLLDASAPPRAEPAAAARDDGGSLGDSAAALARRPNILLIVADDLGYSDVGAFGGEIHTPHLDTLAAEGRLLTSFHTAATCSPTRAMLISGTDHHLVGLGTMAELLRPEQQGKPGYEGYLNERSLSIAELLADSGYHTYMAGKWHLGLTEEKSPKVWGFESSFVLTQGAASHFAPRAGAPTPADTGVYRENGSTVSVPSDFYSSNYYTDKLLGYLEAHANDGKPFFAYAAYTAPHWPLQAPADYIDRYRGRYDGGYEQIHAERIARQKKLGIIAQDFQPNPGLPSTDQNPTWDKLTPEQRKVEARRMEIYAAMVENLDHNIGRLLQYLKRTGQYDDTFIFFQSDNGAEGSLGYADTGADNSYENMGRVGSNVIYGKRWAEVGATPYRLYKAFATEGGVTVPAIARLPRSTRSRPHFDGLTHVSDLAPTFLELAKTADPGSTYKGRSVHPITGHSLLPVLEERAVSVRAAGEVLTDELFGRRYVRRDQWKLTWLDAPWGNNGWSLYDLSKDRGETTDVASAHPDVFNALTGEWDSYAARVGVVLPLVAGTPGRE
jgi:arylsulfatase